MRDTEVAVYGRLKPGPHVLSQDFDLKFGEVEDQITFPSHDKHLPKRKSFRFKKIFDQHVTQEQIFDTVAKPIINNVFSGYNGIIFTCGQTGSGKTYTMTGDTVESENQGLIPRTIQEIFRAKKNLVIKITYCEIYNERVNDLIGKIDSEVDMPRVNQLKNLKITMFRDLSVHKVETAYEALQLLIKGNEKKMTAETDNGSFASRSNVIFSIRLELPCTEDGMLHLNPILYLVDLASAENREGPANNPMETRNINLCLLYLDHVLLALRRSRKVHIPYRNSRMTAFLKNILGGNFITAVIATLSLEVNDIEQTLQTCQIAERLGQITNVVYPNEIVIPSKRIFNPSKDMELLEKEYKCLKSQLDLFLNNQLPEEDLDEDEKEYCAAVVEKFIAGNAIIDFPDGDIRKTIYCFHLMRDEILKKEAILNVPVEIKLSDSPFTSKKELQVETAKAVSGDNFKEKSLEKNNFTELLSVIAPKECELTEGNENNLPENTRTNEIKKAESPKAVAKNPASSIKRSTEEFVLVQKKIADRPELVLCIVKSGEK